MTHEILALAILAGFSLGLAVWALRSVHGEAKAAMVEPEELFSESVFFKFLLPYIQVVARGLERVAALGPLRLGLDKTLLAAGKRESITPDEIVATMIVGAVVGALVGVYVYWALELPQELIAFLALVGFLLPRIALGDLAKTRQNKVRRQLPYLLDLLTLAVEAGLDFTAALARIGDKLKGTPLAVEVKRMAHDIGMGKTRGEALKALATRVQIDEVRAVVSALTQADELGSSLGGILRIMSADLRRKRFQQAEKKALEAPVKLMFPLIVFIFPTVFIMIFGPLAIRLIQEQQLL